MTKSKNGRLFLSWSGSRSRQLAQVFCEWIPLVLPNVVPWMSDVHIEKGERWSDAVGKQLSKSDFGVCCVTLSSQH